jgi:hypothetical protein
MYALSHLFLIGCFRSAGTRERGPLQKVTLLVEGNLTKKGPWDRTKTLVHPLISGPETPYLGLSVTLVMLTVPPSVAWNVLFAG